MVLNYNHDIKLSEIPSFRRHVVKIFDILDCYF